MGLSDLRDLAVIEEVPYEDLAGSVIAVDFNNWLYRYLTIVVRYNEPEVYTTAGGTAVPNLLAIATGLPKFYENNLTPVFVFDGDPPDLKANELQKRRERAEAAKTKLASAEAAGDDAEVRRLRAQSQRLTPTMRQTSRQFLELLDIPIVDAPGEAEAQAAAMATADVVDYVATEDYDAMLFGAPQTIRQMTTSGSLELMNLDATLDRHDITQEQLVDVAILCGTDYNNGIHGVGPKTAVKAIGKGTTVEELTTDYDTEIDALAEVRDMFLSPPVKSDVTFDATVTPDLVVAHQYLVEEWDIPPDSIDKPFNRLSRSLPVA